jgi:hypothetical protein
MGLGVGNDQVAAKLVEPVDGTGGAKIPVGRIWVIERDRPAGWNGDVAHGIGSGAAAAQKAASASPIGVEGAAPKSSSS